MTPAVGLALRFLGSKAGIIAIACLAVGIVFGVQKWRIGLLKKELAAVEQRERAALDTVALREAELRTLGQANALYESRVREQNDRVDDYRKKAEALQAAADKRGADAAERGARRVRREASRGSGPDAMNTFHRELWNGD